MYKYNYFFLNQETFAEKFIPLHYLYMDYGMTQKFRKDTL